MLISKVPVCNYNGRIQMNMRKMNMSIGKEKFIALMNKNVTFISLQISNLAFNKWQESLKGENYCCIAVFFQTSWTSLNLGLIFVL